MDIHGYTDMDIDSRCYCYQVLYFREGSEAILMLLHHEMNQLNPQIWCFFRIKIGRQKRLKPAKRPRFAVPPQLFVASLQVTASVAKHWRAPCWSVGFGFEHWTTLKIHETPSANYLKIDWFLDSDHNHFSWWMEGSCLCFSQKQRPQKWTSVGPLPPPFHTRHPPQLEQMCIPLPSFDKRL